MIASYAYRIEVLPELLDGVELETRIEREAKEIMLRRMNEHLDRELQFALYGDAASPALLIRREDEAST
jgi:hypothetical protein